MADYTADSCSYADVAAKVALASGGDTVNVPSGSANWATTLELTVGINLIGAGIGSTVITNTNGGSPDYLITYNPSDYDANDPFRLSGFTFDANAHKVLQLGDDTSAPFTLQTKIRIDNNKFTNGTETSQKGQYIYNRGSLYGVVENNVFEKSNYPIAHTNGGIADDWWDDSPQNIFTHGSAYYFYYEDNIFDYTEASGEPTITDGEWSARYVFRYNTITVGEAAYALFDLHGEQPTADMASCFGAELYGNQITHGANMVVFLAQRSGQTLVFLNNATGSATSYIKAYTSAACQCPADYADLKVTHNSYWFRNRANLTGSFWSPTCQGGLDCAGLEDIPTLGRDVFSDESSPGISAGTLANIPGTCSVGQGYWATNQSTSDLTGMVGASPATPISGTLYRCLATNVWTEYYTPYTYPHPLRVEVPTETTSRMRMIFI